MRTNNILGLIFANVHDDLLPELTEKRSMASVPFGGRYRLIDFSLSNLANAGISKVGVITRENYQSLLDHIGSGREWDLDRKTEGLYILPPFVSGGISMGVHKTHIEALSSITNFLNRTKQEYVVMCDSDVISNIDISDMLACHAESGADFTIAYKNGKLPKNHEDVMVFTFGENQMVKEISYEKENTKADYSLDIVISSRKLLLDIIKEASERGIRGLSKNYIAANLNNYKIMGYKVEGFAEVLDGTKSYYELNMKMLESKYRKELFNSERPVYTKTHDSMPVKYGIESKVENSLIADGCIIEGTVKNSVIFRNVTVKKGAVIENSIVMQNAVIGENSTVVYSVMDKSSSVEDNNSLIGTKSKIAFLKKDQKIGG